MPFCSKQCKWACFCHVLLTFGIVEFNELWHSLTVPNDVDLLKQLESGNSSSSSPPLSLAPLNLVGGRGSTGHQRGSPCTQSPEHQEEGQAWRGTTTASSANHQHAHEGRDRPLKRLCCTGEVMMKLPLDIDLFFQVIRYRHRPSCMYVCMYTTNR